MHIFPLEIISCRCEEWCTLGLQPYFHGTFVPSTYRLASDSHINTLGDGMLCRLKGRGMRVLRPAVTPTQPSPILWLLMVAWQQGCSGQV